MWAPAVLSLKENPLPHLCQFPEASVLLGSRPPSSICKASNGGLNPSWIHHTNLHSILPPSSTSKDPWVSIEPIWIIPDDLHLKISVGNACATPCADVAPGSRKASHPVCWGPQEDEAALGGGQGSGWSQSPGKTGWPVPEALGPGLRPPGPRYPQ